MRKVNVYRVEVLVIDWDGLGLEQITDVIETAAYPNRCIAPRVKSITGREVEWSDDHPLNKRTTENAAYRALFGLV